MEDHINHVLKVNADYIIELERENLLLKGEIKQLQKDLEPLEGLYIYIEQKDENTPSVIETIRDRFRRSKCV